MTAYTATIQFELGGDGTRGDTVDAATAAALLGERLFDESVEFRITRLSVEEM